MATKKKTAKDRVAALSTHVGDTILISSNPTKEEILGFVEEHNRRYHAGEAGGPSGIPAYLIQSAAFYPSQEDVGNPDKAEEITLPEDVPLIGS